MADSGKPTVGEVIHKTDLDGCLTAVALNISGRIDGEVSYVLNNTTLSGNSSKVVFKSTQDLTSGTDTALVEKKAVVDALAGKVDKSPSPCVSRAMGKLDETGFENIMGVLTYHRITRDAGIFAGDIIFGDCHTLTNYFRLPLETINYVLNIPSPTETCYGTWSIEGVAADKVSTLTGSGRVLRLSAEGGMSFERLYNVSIENGSGSTGAWPFSQFSNSRIHFQVVVV